MTTIENAWRETTPAILGVRRRQIQKQYFALGTQIELTAFGTATEADLDDAYHLIQGYEDRLTVNRDHSELMSVNHAAGDHPVQVSASTYALTKLAVAVSRENCGFNAAIGPLVKLWRIGFSGANVPTETAIEKRQALCNPQNILLDDDNLTVFLTKPGMELDLGGIAKGYIADRIRDLWRSRGIQSGMINLGGNLLTMGPCPLHPDGLWRIGVQDPAQSRGRVVATVHQSACSAVTSGIYERYLKKDGHTYHHIIDPRTGHPLKTTVAGVTVFTRDSVVGEIESTRLFFAGHAPKGWAQDNPDIYGAVFVYQDHHVERVGFANKY